MTPAAITPAGRGASTKSKTPRPVGGGAPGHRRAVRPGAAPRSPRRVSGPVGGRAAATAPPRAQLTGRTAAPRHGRLGPALPQLAARAHAFVRTLPDHALLDRVVRGRTWIALLGVMLAGIVAMQVEVLKLGASLGRSIERSTALQSRNELLRESVASLADDQRIERLAAGMGMVMPAPADVGFLSARSGATAQRAVSNIHAPDAQSFLTLTTTNGAVTTGPDTTGTTLAPASAASSGTSAAGAPGSSQLPPPATGVSAAGGPPSSPPGTGSTPTPGVAATTGTVAAPVGTQPTSTSSTAQTSSSTSGGVAVSTGG